MPQKKNRDVSGLETNDSSTLKVHGDNHFLGIGINEYKNFDKLHNAVKDIKDFNQLMIGEFGFDEKRMHLLFDQEATRRNIIRKLNILNSTVKKNDRVLIYYSGHGFLNKQTSLGYWIPVDAEQGFIGDYITNSEVRDLINAIKCRHVLLISDSCFSGSMLTRDIGTKAVGAFDQWEENDSRWIFCSGKGVVADGEKGKNSPFAKELIKHLSDSNIDKININLLADKVVNSVRFSYKQQAEASPLYGAGHDGGQFIFYKKISETEKGKIAFEKTKTSKNKTTLQKYLSSVENKTYKKEIRKILRKLEQKEEWTKVNKKSFAALDEFIDEHPDSPFLKDAQKILDSLRDKGTLIPKSEKPDPEIFKPPLSPPPLPIITNEKELVPNPELYKESVFEDYRDGKIYKTVQLKDGKIWMAENLNFDVGKSCWYPNDDVRLGQKYGRFYTYKSALKACPPGWRIPTAEEWVAMALMEGGYNDWDNHIAYGDPQKTYHQFVKGEASKFNITFAGYRDSDGPYLNFKKWACFWTTSKYGWFDRCYFLFNKEDEIVEKNSWFSGQACSIRCVKSIY